MCDREVQILGEEWTGAAFAGDRPLFVLPLVAIEMVATGEQDA